MNWVLIILALGLAASEKLDRNYLPPPGAKLSGGSPGSIQVPFELPKETYQPTGALVAENGLPVNNELQIGLSINKSEPEFGRAASYIKNAPTPTTSYAFTQTTNFPAVDSYMTASGPINPTTGLPIQYSTKNEGNLGFSSIPSKQINKKYSSFGQSKQQTAPSTNDQPETSEKFVNFGQPNNIESSQPLSQYRDQYQNTVIPFDSTRVISSFPNKPLDSYPGQRIETQNLDSSYNQGDYSLGITSQQYPGSQEPSRFLPGNVGSNYSSFPGYFRKPSYFSTTSFPPVVSTVHPTLSNYIYSERPQAEADRQADTLNFENVRTLNEYSYSFDTSNGIHADETGVIENGTKARGGYSYIGDDGKNYTITYTADENGFQPHGDHLPTPPPIPEAIQKIIERVAMEEAAGIADDGSYDEKKYGDYIYQEYKNRYNIPSYDKFVRSKSNDTSQDYIRKTPILKINDDIFNRQNEAPRKDKNVIVNKNRVFNQILNGAENSLAQDSIGSSNPEKILSGPGEVKQFKNVSILSPISVNNKNQLGSSKYPERTKTIYSEKQQDSIPDSTFIRKETYDSFDNIDTKIKKKIYTGEFDTSNSTLTQKTGSGTDITDEQSKKHYDNSGYIYKKPQINLEQSRFSSPFKSAAVQPDDYIISNEATTVKPFMTHYIYNKEDSAQPSLSRKPLINFDVLPSSKEGIYNIVTENNSDQPEDKVVSRDRFSPTKFSTKTIGTTSLPPKFKLTSPGPYSVNNQEIGMSQAAPGFDTSNFFDISTTPVPSRSSQFDDQHVSKNKLISQIPSKFGINAESDTPVGENSSSNLPSSPVSNSFGTRLPSVNRITPQSYSTSNYGRLPITSESPESNLGSVEINSSPYQTNYQYVASEPQSSYGTNVPTSRPSLSIPSGSAYSTTSYEPNFPPKRKQPPGITVDNFGRPINSEIISYPGYSAKNSELSSDENIGINTPGSFGTVKYPQYFTTERVTGEDFTGPKQPQKFDPETGYHYK